MAKETNFWQKIFMVIGIIAVIFIIMVIGAVVALIIIKPYGVDVTKFPDAYSKIKSGEASSYDHPLLSNEQEILLETAGVDVQNLPTEITPEQEQCAVEALGAERVNQINQGASPTLDDYLKAQDCF